VTLAGFLAEKLQHLPKKGERISYEGFCFQIQQASSRRVLQVLIFEDKGLESSPETSDHNDNNLDNTHMSDKK